MNSHYRLIHRIIFFLFLILIPAFIFIFYTIYHTNSSLKNQALSSVHIANTSYIEKIDKNFSQIYELHYNLQSQPTYEIFSDQRPYMSPYEYGTFVNNMRKQLDLLESLNPLLESIHNYYPKLKIMYHSAGYAPYGSYTKLDETLTQKWESILAEDSYLHHYTDPISGEKKLALMDSPGSPSHSYHIILNFSTDTLKKELDENCIYEEDYYYYTTDCGFTLSNLDPALQSSVDWNGLKESDPSKPWISLKLNGKTWYAFPYHMTYSGGYFVRLVSASSILNIIPFSYVTMFLFFILLLTACICFFIAIYRMIHKPLASMTQAFTQIENGNFQVQITEKSNSDFAYLFQGFNHMTKKLNELIEKTYTQTVLLQKAELKQLQAQINPHFLYNSFFMLQHMIRWDPPQAQEIAGALARYFQYITRNSQELVPLKAEYAHTKDYLSIQEMRFSERITIKLEDFPESYAYMQVPKLILQPVLENSFKYGLQHKEENGLLLISFHPEEEHLKIVFEDNGEELNDSTLNELSSRLDAAATQNYSGEFTGLLNIQRRLTIVSHLPHPLRVFRSELGGLGIEMTLTSPEEKPTPITNEEVSYESVNRR